MEKIYIKAISNEIVARGQVADGYTDIFSYEGESPEDTKKLGSLFVVGHVRNDSEDTAYLINLIAALAKREYYARPGIPPKQAFSGTLTKINDVVEEFFKNKELELNIGIFVITDGQVHISRLGKFKIFLARSEKTIDILNNIEFFEKEHIQNKKFSNIISGKLEDADRILAFYPAQSVSSRERFIKNHFLKLAEADFVNKINGLKAKSEQFSCALLYITMQNVREAAVAPRIEPQELAQAQLAAQPGSRFSGSADSRKTASENSRPGKTAADMAAARESSDTPRQAEQEVPNIIPSEFSRGTRDNPILSLMKRFRLPVIRPSRSVKFAALALIVVSVAGAGFGTYTYLTESPQEKQAKASLEAIKADIQKAQSLASNNDAPGARNILFASISTLGQNSQTVTKEESQQVEESIVSALNAVDKSSDVVPSLFYQIPAELGSARLMTSFEETLLAYAVDEASQGGHVVQIKNDVAPERFALNDITPEILFENSGSPVLFSKNNGKIASLRNGSYTTYVISVPAGYISGSMYQDNLYALAPEGIFKITDAARGAQKSEAWLAKDTPPPADGIQIFVDGNVYVLSSSGSIKTYYKGAVNKEIQAPFKPNAKTVFFSSYDSPSLYLFQKDVNRIYVLDKKSGELQKTYHINSPQEILAVAITATDTLYFLTPDNKIWTVK